PGTPYSCAPSLRAALPISADGARRVRRVERREHEMPRVRRLERRIHGDGVPDLTGHDDVGVLAHDMTQRIVERQRVGEIRDAVSDRKSTRLNSSHVKISYA